MDLKKKFKNKIYVNSPFIFFSFLLAINDACLVYDGKLVIDAAFHTNDVSVRGAGTITKYQRKYHAEQWSHANFNSKEVGVHVSRNQSAGKLWLAVNTAKYM